MFIYSVRASSVRFFAILALTVTVLVVILGLGGRDAVFASSDGEAGYNYSGAEEKEGRVAFLSQFGIEVNSESEAEESFTMPEDFDRVMLGYNELQKLQGLDLSKYEKKKVTRFTYEVTNCSEADGVVFANLLVYRGRVIGCDYSTADPEGFVKPLTDFPEKAGI
ncbi:MAG: DUF4830 domain-containing protein [Clostridia bacterium]|nr:DUF4830 domain-containing protein [Clostridia bacterium]